MSTATSVSVFTCGSELDARNPLYHKRFQASYDTWLKQKLGDAQSSGCWEACVDTRATAISTALTTHLPDLYRCGKCIHDLVESRQKTAARQGGGCSLCVDVVAPWAYRQHTTTLPTADELQTFVKGPYQDAHRVFQTLPACERAEWTRAVCGGDTPSGKEYPIPLEVVSTTPTQGASSGLSTGAIVGIIVVVLLVIIIGLVIVRWRRRVNQQHNELHSESHTDEHKTTTESFDALIKSGVKGNLPAEILPQQIDRINCYLKDIAQSRFTLPVAYQVSQGNGIEVSNWGEFSSVLNAIPPSLRAECKSSHKSAILVALMQIRRNINYGNNNDKKWIISDVISKITKIKCTSNT
jgi:hypothetical protein